MILEITKASQIWETYAKSWGAASTEEKRKLYEQSLERDCTYTDPLTVAQGWEELQSYMLQFHEQVPGGHFITTQFSAHHNCCLANWEMRTAKGDIAGIGVSFGKFSKNGKLKSMTGFFQNPES